MPAQKTVYQIKVTLVGSKLPIWRRILVTDKVSLGHLHAILQIAMGWTDSHLHMFTINGQAYGDPEADEAGELGSQDEYRYRLDQFVSGEGFEIRYEYDFGDSWEHILQVEKILPAEKGVRYPICISARRACPPEDVGGVWGYENFLQAISDPKHEQHDEYREWIGGDFDPEEFDLDEVNERLRHYKQYRQEVSVEYSMPKAEAGQLEKVIAWTQRLPGDVDRFDALPVRRDMLAFLSYLLENRTVGTQSTGNLPLKAVHAICAQFADPPELEGSIGDYHYRVRSEDDVWPLVYVHTLASAGGLVTGGPARIWKVTEDGLKYPQIPSPVQVVFLLQCWWHSVDWTIAFPFTGFRDGLPPGFNMVTLACLLELPVGEASSYAAFADRVIRNSGLVWPIDDQVSARDILHSAIERMVIQPLVDFSVLECEHGIKTVDRHDDSELVRIRLSPVGKGMLELLK
ncbi:MAG: plasmid pRiA4b ORF-3 family protein [Anaerolineales bacterium]|nr:plasmid pRiA4b ORF-3 family protein [Anaerolineales bacterium]